MPDRVRIEVLGAAFETAADDSLLRALHLFGRAQGLPEYGFNRFCWNASCHQCVTEVERDGRSEHVHACQVSVEPELVVRRVPALLAWPVPIGKWIRRLVP